MNQMQCPEQTEDVPVGFESLFNGKNSRRMVHELRWVTSCE